MRFSRACSTCWLLVLCQVSHVYCSSSPPTQGAGIFGSPIVHPLHVSPVVANASMNSSSNNMNTPAATSSASHIPWQSRFTTSHTMGQNSASLVNTAFQQQNNDYATVGSAGSALRAGSPPHVVAERDVVLKIPTVESGPAAGQPPAAAPAFAHQADSAAAPFPGPQLFPSSHTAPTLGFTDHQEERSSSRPGDLPQLKRSSPWLFSATREKLLGAINFMKHTEEQGSYTNGNTTSFAKPAESAGSGSARYQHLMDRGVPESKPLAGAAISGGGTAADLNDRDTPLQPHTYTSKNNDLRSDSAQDDKPLEDHVTSAPPTAANRYETAFDINDVRNHYFSTVSYPFSQTDQLSRPPQLLQLQARPQRQPNQQLPLPSRAYNTIQMSQESTIYQSPNGDQRNATKQKETDRPTVQALQVGEENQQLQSSWQKPQQPYPSPQQLLLQHQPVLLEAAAPGPRPSAEKSVNPLSVPMQTGDSHLLDMDYYIHRNVYVSEAGEAPADGVRMTKGILQPVILSFQIPPIARVSPDTSYFDGRHDKAPSGEGATMHAHRTRYPPDVGAAGNTLFHAPFTTSGGQGVPSAYHENWQAQATHEGVTTLGHIHLSDEADMKLASNGKAPLAGGVAQVSKSVAPDAHTREHTEKKHPSETPDCNLELLACRTVPREMEIILPDDLVAANAYRLARIYDNKAAYEKASTVDGALKAREILRPEAPATRGVGPTAEGTLSAERELFLAGYHPLTPPATAASPASPGRTSAKGNVSSRASVPGTFDVEARIQSELDRKRGTLAGTDKNYQIRPLLVNQAAPADAFERPGAEAIDRRYMEDAYVLIEGSKTDAAAPQDKLEQKESGVHAKLTESGGVPAPPSFTSSTSTVLEENTEGTPEALKTLEGTGKGSEAEGKGTLLSVPKVNATGAAAPVPYPEEYVSPHAAPSAEWMTAVSRPYSRSTRQAANVGIWVPVQRDAGRSTWLAPQASPVHIVSVPSGVPESVTDDQANHAPSVPPVASLRNVSAEAFLTTGHPPAPTQLSRQEAEPSSVAAAGTARREPADLPSPSSSGEVPLPHAQNITVPPFLVTSHVERREEPFTAPAKFTHPYQAGKPSMVALLGDSPLPSTEFSMMTRPLGTPGEASVPTSATAMPHPSSFNPQRTLPGGSTAPATYKGAIYPLAPVSASYAMSQGIVTPYPTSSVAFIPNARPMYVSPTTKRDVRPALPPAPVYIGQSIRQEMTSGPPVYPLGARLYERMIPRAELILASSTYAEEYFDLVAALYCLFHKWPCNNVQEFAEETRKRQDVVNSRQGDAKTAA